jgi:hypothetical protein
MCIEREVIRRLLMRLCTLRFLYITDTGVLLMFPVNAFSQSTAPAAPPAPPDFPSYIVKPSEDLNPYELSTVLKSTGIEYGQGEGTLGTSEQRSSNIEVNAALQKKREDRLKAAKEAKAKSAAKTAAEESGRKFSPEEITPSLGP